MIVCGASDNFIAEIYIFQYCCNCCIFPFFNLSIIFCFGFCFVEQFFLNDPELADETPTAYLSHKELYEYAIRKATVIFRKIRTLQEEGKDGVDNYM